VVIFFALFKKKNGCSRIRFTLRQNQTVGRVQGPMLTLGNPAGISGIKTIY